jgi:hypothetical protein
VPDRWIFDHAKIVQSAVASLLPGWEGVDEVMQESSLVSLSCVLHHCILSKNGVK